MIPVDYKIIDMVSEFGYEKKSIVDSVMMNRHNKLTTCYYLILKKMIRKGESSIADISDHKFRP